MVTIRRHPVPTNSYDPKRPLNDLLVSPNSNTSSTSPTAFL